MLNPIARLIQYGATPVNSQARNFLSHKKKRKKKKPRKNKKQAAKSVDGRILGIGPFSGKKKAGLNAHIEAMHPGMLGAGGSLRCGEVADPAPKELKKHKAASSTTQQGGPYAIYKGEYVPLSVHLAIAHAVAVVECPFCFEKNTFKSCGSKRCTACRKAFCLGNKFRLVGVQAECLDCDTAFYTERLGFIACPNCLRKSTFNSQGKAI